MEIEINGLSKKQRRIADLMWQCDSINDVHNLINQCGVDARIVFEMIIAHTVDNDVIDCGVEDAATILSRFTLGK